MFVRITSINIKNTPVQPIIILTFYNINKHDVKCKKKRKEG
ncbi:MAG: hypothetical protein JETT_0449 [Candidatus Jettenia ecosi]|uniref:Uncharacterized protein n=1 Tax=Candidatus Jettenia ecosi TaxID=2494326 RepID=A0A533QRM9_9BACT|nr:MAG: hypothetical protein JETT_0449 [Candidatus Jettenia ecosi]